MIIALVGVTGIGKSFFKNQIVENLKFKNLVIVTTRNKRDGENKHEVYEREKFKIKKTK